VTVDGFEAYVLARSTALARTAYLLTGDWALAEDLLQESLAAVAARWSAVSRGGDPDPYVRRVMYHRSIDSWRRRRHIREVSLDAMRKPRDVVGADAEERVVRRLVLREALERLTPKQRAVLVLRFYEDLTEVETAQMLGCSVSTVKSQSRHALTRLRELAPDLIDVFVATAEVEAR
jgi:RNA polymerase sigma-70 factor (sigma-E family)